MSISLFNGAWLFGLCKKLLVGQLGKLGIMRTSSIQRIQQNQQAGYWREQTLHGLLLANAARTPQTIALKDPPNTPQLIGVPPMQLAWKELANASQHLAKQLSQKGLRKDDVLMVQLPNTVHLAVCYYAASLLGAIISPLAMQYGRHELQLVAQTTKAKALVTLASFNGEERKPHYDGLLSTSQTWLMNQDLVLDAAACEWLVDEQDPHQILSLCWTSGTTGTPKAVPRSHAMWVAIAKATMAAGGMQAEDKLLNPFPLINMAAVGGFLYPAALLACGLYLHHPLDPAVFLGQMQSEAISFSIVPPPLLNQLANAPEMWHQFDFSALRAVGSGSAPLADWMIETFDADYKVPVINFYGSNEGICLFATPTTAPDAAVRSCMFQLPDTQSGTETKIADAVNGQTITEIEVPGELMIKGPAVFDGYYAHDNSDVFDSEGYFRTGDMVVLCDTQPPSYRIVGRCKDIINRGGMKISPQELDLALEQHPSCLEAAVCAYPDDKLGEKVCACLVLKEGSPEPSVEDLQTFLTEQGFATFKLPQKTFVIPQLPRNPLGKVQRHKLEQLITTE